jgi:hypothetical protein
MEKLPSVSFDQSLPLLKTLNILLSGSPVPAHAVLVLNLHPEKHNYDYTRLKMSILLQDGVKIDKDCWG